VNRPESIDVNREIFWKTRKIRNCSDIRVDPVQDLGKGGHPVLHMINSWPNSKRVALPLFNSKAVENTGKAQGRPF
jgi:hypothetical protein